MRRAAVASVALLATVTLLTGCQKEEAEKLVAPLVADAQETPEAKKAEEKKSPLIPEIDDNLSIEEGARIAVVSKCKKGEFWDKVKEGMEAAVKDVNEAYGFKKDKQITMTFEGPDNEEDVESQINTLDAVIAENPSVVCLSAGDMDSCQAQLEAAKENGIPVPITKKSPYSIDENLWGRANECGILENPWNSAPEDAYARTNSLEDTPNEADVITLTFENGVPVKLNDEALQLDVLIQKLDKLAGKHGIGRIDHVENRLVGIKSREVYECPAATVLMAAHKDIEDITLEKSLAHFKIYIEDKLVDVIYNGLWFSPLMNSLLAFIKESQKDVNGTVRVKLFKGNVICEGRKSANSLYDEKLATYTSADEFDQEAAAGFIKLYGLPTQVYAQVHQKGEK